MARSSDASLERSIAATPIFADIAPARVRELAAEGRIRSFRRGTYLCHQGDDPDDVFFLVSGRVEVSSVSPTGSRVLHATVDTPQFIGELGVVGDLPRSADLLALDDSQIWTLDGIRFVDLVTSEPAAARQMLAALARQVHEHQAFSDDLLFLDLKGRVAKRLLQMGTSTLADLPDDGTEIARITHADLASLCGGSRENVSRILSDFQRRGLVGRDGDRLVLRKVSGLAKIADV